MINVRVHRKRISEKYNLFSFSLSPLSDQDYPKQKDKQQKILLDNRRHLLWSENARPASKETVTRIQTMEIRTKKKIAWLKSEDAFRLW